jgi:O-antigen ligase
MTDTLRKAPRDLTLAVRVCIVLAVFVSVGVFDLGSQKPFDVVKFSTLWFFGWLAVGAFSAQVVRRRERVGRSTMGWLALGFVVSSGISTMLSRTRMTALFGWYGRYTGLVTICVLVAVFFVVANVYRERPDRARDVIWALSAGALVLIFYIVLQWAHLDPVKWSTTAGTIPGLRYFGTMGNADFAGGYIGFTTPCVFYAFVRSDAVWKRGLVALWGLAQLWTLWLTSARNGIAALGLAIVALLFCYRKSLPRAIRWGAFAAIVAVGAVALAIIVGAAGSAARRPAATVLRSDTVKVRAYWWLAGVRVFEHHPIFGTGPDTFVSEYEQYLPAKAAQVADSEIADKPHNVFIDHLATQGLVGTGLYVALLLVAFVRGYRRLRDGPRGSQLIVATLLALLAAYAAQAFFSIDVIPLALGGWLVLGAIAALADPPPVTERAIRPRTATMATAGILAVAVLVATIGTFPLIADHEAHTAQRLAAAQSSVDEVVAHYEKARRWQPFEPIYAGSEGDYLEKQASGETDPTNARDLLIQAVGDYRKMLSLQPGYHLWIMTLAKGYGDLAAAGGASFEVSDRLFKEALVRGPYDWRVPTAYGDMLFAQARRRHSAAIMCRAQAEYRNAIRLRPDEPSPFVGLGKTFLALGDLERAVAPFRRAARFDKSNLTNARSLLKSTQDLIAQNKSIPVTHC